MSFDFQRWEDLMRAERARSMSERRRWPTRLRRAWLALRGI